MSALRVIAIGTVLALLGVVISGLTGCGSDEPASGPESTDAAGGPELYPAPIEGKWGYIDTTGAWVIEPQFGSASAFSGDLAPARPCNDWRWGYIDATGAFFIEPQFASAGFFGEEGIAPVGLLEAGERSESYIDETGRLLTEESFDETWPFFEGLGLVRRDGKYGYVDTTGRMVIPLDFYHAQSFSDGLAAACPQPGQPYGYIDTAGAWVIEPQFESAGRFSDGLACIGGEGGYGFIDKTGAVVIEPQFDLVADFSEGLAVVSGLVPGQSTVPPAGPHGVMGTVLVQYEPKGYIDTTGRLAIEGAFDSAGPFAGGLAVASAGGKAGYIDTTGAWVIEPRFDIAYAFHGDLAFVCLDRGTDIWAYIDRTGAVIWESGPGAYESHETGASPTTTVFTGPPTSSSAAPPTPPGAVPGT